MGETRLSGSRVDVRKKRGPEAEDSAPEADWEQQRDPRRISRAENNRLSRSRFRAKGQVLRVDDSSCQETSLMTGK